MRKLNRRDYLIQMGAGATGLMAASELPLVGQTRKTKSTPRQTQSRAKSVSKPLTWPTTTTPPDLNAFVTVVYYGLSGFAYHNTNPKFIEVLFHPGDGHHELEIQIYRNPVAPENCLLEGPPIPAVATDVFSLEPSGQPDPNVFEVDSKFTRHTTDAKYDLDFRWLPDLHSLEFYSEGYDLNPVPAPRLQVHTGTFYTRVRTNATFQLVDADSTDCDGEGREYGRIALYMATAINAQRDFSLLKNGRIVYTFKIGNTYQVVFRNECMSCNTNPSECEDAKRNDFHFNREVLKIPAGRTKYGLKLMDKCPGITCAEPNFCIQLDKDRGKRLTDEAPCSGTGYGKSPGFPK